MNLKEKIELEFLRDFTSRIVDIVDRYSEYDWRNDLKADVRATPMAFTFAVDSEEDLNSALEAAIRDIATRLGLDRKDIPTLH